MILLFRMQWKNHGIWSSCCACNSILDVARYTPCHKIWSFCPLLDPQKIESRLIWSSSISKLSGQASNDNWMLYITLQALCKEIYVISIHVNLLYSESRIRWLRLWALTPVTRKRKKTVYISCLSVYIFLFFLNHYNGMCLTCTIKAKWGHDNGQQISSSSLLRWWRLKSKRIYTYQSQCTLWCWSICRGLSIELECRSCQGSSQDSYRNRLPAYFENMDYVRSVPYERFGIQKSTPLAQIRFFSLFANHGTRMPGRLPALNPHPSPCSRTRGGKKQKACISACSYLYWIWRYSEIHVRQGT